MNKKILLGFYLLTLITIAFFTSKTMSVKAYDVLDRYRENTTVLVSNFYFYEEDNGELVKTPAVRIEFERNDDLSIKAEALYRFDETAKEFVFSEKHEYAYDENGNTTYLKLYDNIDGETRYDGGYFYTYENGKLVYMEEHDNDDGVCHKEETTYSGNVATTNIYYLHGDNYLLEMVERNTYDEKGNITRYERDNYNWPSFTSLEHTDVIEYTYDSKNRVIKEEAKEYSGGNLTQVPFSSEYTEYKYIDNSANQKQYIENHYTYDNSTSTFKFESSLRETSTIDKNGRITNMIVEYKHEENEDYVLHEECTYEHMPIKKNNAIWIILVILLIIILIICGLFAAWKIEVEKKGLDNENRLLKFLDKIFIPINNLLFVEKAKKEVKE